MNPYRLSENQKRRCLKVLDQIERNESFYLYKQPVDPVRDECPDYFQVISEPMDLSTIRRKLLDDKYTSISEWKNDFSLIWKNSKKYNNGATLIGLTAQYLQETFKSLTQTMSDNEVADWTSELTKVQTTIRQLLNQMPGLLGTAYKEPHPPGAPGQPSAKSKIIYKSDDFDEDGNSDDDVYGSSKISRGPQNKPKEKKRSSKGPSKNKSTKSKSRIDSPRSPVYGADAFSPHSPPSPPPKPKTQKTIPPPRSSSPPRAQTSPPQTQAPPSYPSSPPYSSSHDDDLVDLADRINRLQNESDVVSVLDVIKKYEPQLGIKDEVDMEIGNFNQKTIRALTGLLDAIERRDGVK